MNKRIFIASILVFNFIMLNAQKFNFGLTAGAVTSQIDGDGLFGFNKLGPIAGLNWYYKINDKKQIQFDFDYLNIGSNYKAEARFKPSEKEKNTLLSVDFHSVSFFTGMNFGFKEIKDNFFLYRFSVGARVSKGFIINTYRHEISKEEVELDDNSLTSILFNPEIRLGFNLSEKIHINFISSISANNLLRKSQFNLNVLRPFYLGGTISYVIKS